MNAPSLPTPTPTPTPVPVPTPSPNRPLRLCLLAVLYTAVSTLSSCTTSADLPAEYWVADIYHAGLDGKNPVSALTFAP